MSSTTAVQRLPCLRTCALDHKACEAEPTLFPPRRLSSVTGRVRPATQHMPRKWTKFSWLSCFVSGVQLLTCDRGELGVRVSIRKVFSEANEDLKRQRLSGESHLRPPVRVSNAAAGWGGWKSVEHHSEIIREPSVLLAVAALDAQVAH